MVLLPPEAETGGYIPWGGYRAIYDTYLRDEYRGGGTFLRGGYRGYIHPYATLGSKCNPSSSERQMSSSTRLFRFRLEDDVNKGHHVEFLSAFVVVILICCLVLYCFNINQFFIISAKVKLKFIAKYSYNYGHIFGSEYFSITGI